jgi:RNA polymerase sigma-70 factor, ECF subfamily
MLAFHFAGTERDNRVPWQVRGRYMLDDENRWAPLVLGLREGDRQIVQEFCENYGGLLSELAEKHLAGPLRRRVGPEDVAQSACRTFLRRVRAGEFELADSEGLWRLLCAITLTKVREQARFHQRKKRDLAQEMPFTMDDSDRDAARFEPAVSGPSPAEAVEFADQFQQLMLALDDEERQLVDLKLQQYTNDEVAERLGCSERTVRRLLKQVRSRLERALAVSQ